MTRDPAPASFHGQERLHALDNMRTTLIVLVVMLHAACAYSSLIPWWPVRQGPHWRIFDLLVAVCWWCSRTFAWITARKQAALSPKIPRGGNAG